MEYSIRISRAEFNGRIQRLLDHIKEENLLGVVLFDSTNILYYTGFAFISTERPIALAMNADGETAMFVPRLEVEHVQAETAVTNIAHYIEYPGKIHPMLQFRELLDKMGMIPPAITINTEREKEGMISLLPHYLEAERKQSLLPESKPRIGADLNGYPWIFGYEGPSLTELTNLNIISVQGAIHRQQMLKSDAELNLIRESCKWGHLAHMLLQKYTAVNETETAVTLRASQEATLTMMDTIGPLYRAQSMWVSGPFAGYRGQIGRNAAIPHALANNIRFQPGDVLVTGASCPMWGYNSELERTMFVGEPSTEQQQMFAHMLALQQIAFEAMGPGTTCADVDRAVRHYYEKNKLLPYWKHHTGHAIGLKYHEGPYLDMGDDTIMLPGMVFTVEPGLYVPELGGFRHSDTVAITSDGIEIMTYYPRDWQSLVIPV
jgi:Xaa-Pro aminopeptidase